MLLLAVLDITKSILDHKDLLQAVGSIFPVVIAILGVSWAVIRWIIEPIWQYFASPWIKIIKNFVKRANDVPEKLDNVVAILNNDIQPFITSFQYEFSKNSGKSIKDQITRIDNTVRLSELRSKMISDKLLTLGQFECDDTGKCIWVNNALAEMYNMSKEEMLGNGWLTAIHENERMDIWKRWRAFIEQHIPFDCDYSVLSSDGKGYFRVHSTAACLTTIDGKILSYYGDVIKLPSSNL